MSQQIDEILAKDPNNPGAAQAIARRNLNVAQRALDAKDFAKAIAAIEAGQKDFVDPRQQADAMFTIAQARLGIALTSKNANDLRDAALAYMRVVADFKDLPTRPHAAEALLKTAQIEEQLGDGGAAAQLYQQIIKESPQDPAAITAKESAARLGSR